MKKKKGTRRDLFAELMEGVDAMRAHREGKVTLRTHTVAPPKIGHKTTCPFGVPLASLLYALPPTEQAKALESIRVMRLLISDRYADIHVTRTLEGARELLILPGDRIEWKG